MYHLALGTVLGIWALGKYYTLNSFTVDHSSNASQGNRRNKLIARTTQNKTISYYTEWRSQRFITEVNLCLLTPPRTNDCQVSSPEKDLFFQT